MLSLDIYLSSLTDEAYNDIKDEIMPTEDKSVPLLSWDIFCLNYANIIEDFKTESDIKIVKTFAKKAKWKNEIDAIFKDQDFEALIITDADQNILWVNDGFTTMTGYSKTYALNKKPYFLQGENTSMETRKSIRNKLNDLKPFTAVLTNYKKDNSPYECEVKIIPMYGDNVTHYLALEKKIV